MKAPARKAQLAVLLAVVLLLSSFSAAFAQSASDTNFTTSVTYGNAGTDEAQILFSFYSEGSGSPAATENVTLQQNATSSLFLGNVDALTGAFQGSGTISANVPVVAVLVQVPQNNPDVVNRPLSNGFRSGASQSTIATVLKDTFGQVTSFSCQNADTQPVDITAEFINTSAQVVHSEVAQNVPVGAAKFFEAETIGGVPGGFNGSARVTAVASGTSNPANIVCSVSELGTSGDVNQYKAKAFEGAAQAGTNFFVSSALCDVFGGQSTAYAVTNASSNDTANVTVQYTGGATDQAQIGPGAKNSFLACDVNNPGYSGAATITSTGAEVVAVAKKFQSGRVFETAFAGEAAGGAVLRMPYIRWAPDGDYNDGSGRWQRAFIAIQNVGGSAASNVPVRYYDVNGTLVGTHVIGNIPAGGKANSDPSQMTLAGGVPNDAKIWFGTPTGNSASSGQAAFGGGAVVGDDGSGQELIGIASIVSTPSSGQVQEDYNAQQ